MQALRPGRARLYFCDENSGLPKLLLWLHALRSDQDFSIQIDILISLGLYHHAYPELLGMVIFLKVYFD